MSVALERSNSGGDHRIERSGFAHRNMAFASSIYNSAELSGADQRFEDAQQVVLDDRSGSLSSSSTSSIGKNSDDSSRGGGGGCDGEEVQSEYKGGPLDSLEALEDVLPVKKSISKFYCGKSKSFTSLSDAATFSTIEDITKPENAYTKKRKNLLAFNNFWDKNHNILRGSKGGISKRPTNSRSMLSLAATMNCSEANSGETSNSNSSSGCCLPPLPPHARRAIQIERSSSPPADKFSSWRSFSLSDLQGAAGVDESSDPSSTGLWSNKSEK
ncbi:hypothetical protein BUALT_Bualt16G0042300 [Buddleja alternifolia]|uniref:MTD1 n=1 Tax=Buddleja alternifolia TaxID=168488 RepID=A0AAV6W9J6_9LAMI|nr:hypothetical protein BUALT_Bualt16G0042300 [Buddleja alternifolia]